MPDPRPARRVALRWGDREEDEAVLEAARDLHPRLEGRDLQLGDRVEAAQGVALVVTSTDPPGLVTVGEDTTLEVTAPESEGRRPVHDAVLLVDASYTMRKGDAPPSRFVQGGRHLEGFVRHATDFVRRAALVTFTHEPRVVQPLGPVEELEVARLADLEPRGRSRPAEALTACVELLQREGEPRHHHAVVLVTDGDGGTGSLGEIAARARNLGIVLHVAQVGRAPPVDDLRDAAEVTGGVFAHGGDGAPLERVFHAMSSAVDVPAAWRAPPPPGEDVEFEVIVRATDDEEDEP